MRYIRKGKPPQDIQQARQSWLPEHRRVRQTRDQGDAEAWRSLCHEARGRFDRDFNKSESRKHLVKEQGYLCAFCLRRISEVNPTESPTGTIHAHWMPLEQAPERIFDWDNLFGTCSGVTGTVRHCDASQGNQVLTLKPDDPAIERQLRYRESGRVEAVGEEQSREVNEVLNLNHERLVENRKAVLDVVRKELSQYKNTCSQSELMRIRKRWELPNQNGQLPPYNRVALDYLDRKIQKAPA